MHILGLKKVNPTDSSYTSPTIMNPRSGEASGKVPRNSSVFFGFKILGYAYRLVGLCIFTSGKKPEDLNFLWRKVWPWVIYSLTLWGIVLSCLAFFLLSFHEMWKRDPDFIDLNNLFHFGLLVQLSWNYLIMVCHMLMQGSNIVNGVKQMHKIEIDLGFSLKQRWLVVVLAFVLLLFHVLYCVRVFLNISDGESNVAFKAFHMSLTGRVILIIMGWIWLLTTIAGSYVIPTWIIFTSTFFRRCFARIQTQLQAIGKECSECPCNCEKSVLRLRQVYVCCVEALILCNNILSKGILITYASNLILCCFAVSLAIRDTNHVEIANFIELFLGGILKMIVPLIAVGLMQSEEQTLCLAINKLATISRCSSFIQEVTLFKMSLQSQHVTFNGCGLFDLNLPLMLSIIQSIITYAVLLIQTRPSDIPTFANNTS